MALLTTGLIVLVAVLHAGFLVLEMFLWTKPIGLKIFRQSAEKAEHSRVLAANQGLYNGFLAVGLVLGVVLGESGRSLIGFLLACVIAAGLYGGWTVSRRIIVIQALPAALALALFLMQP